ncbi:MAG: glycosyltransferase family 2 protein [Pseudorhodoplanes sp.]
MLRLSAIVIAKDEEKNIGACLDSLKFCDERIVVDGGSEDATAAIAEKKGARVVVNPEWNGFGPQKNFALSLAKGDWVFSIDADERVSPELAASMRGVIAEGLYDAYEMPRLSSFCGKPMRHSGWYPDYVLRLFRRGKARFSDDLVHEKLICEGEVSRLREPLIHHPVARLEDSLSRMDRYSTARAQMIVDSGRRVSFMTGIVRGLWTFLQTYFIRLGFLDGREGFLLAVLNAEGTYYRYMKAWLKGRTRD